MPAEFLDSFVLFVFVLLEITNELIELCLSELFVVFPMLFASFDTLG